MTKIKRVLRRATRLPARVLRKIDRTVQRGFAKIFRALYKIKFLRPATKKTYRFVHYHHRISAAMMFVLIVLGVAIPVLQPYLRSQRYELNAHAQELLGKADQDLTKKITFDDQKQLYQFNKDAKKDPVTGGNPLEKLKSQVGGAGEKDEQLYSVDVSKDLSKGVTYYDNQMQLSFKLTPQFSTMPGEQKAGHLVYPLNGTKGQLAYTVDASGMKENVVLYKSPGNTFNMSYKLDLPKSLEARLIPETGEVGIYSADPTLFGNISYGSSDDQAKVEAARNNSEKTFLTFKVPAPIVMGLGKTDQRSIAPVQSKFELSGDTLRVVTTGLDKAEYPLSIDPTITVDSSSDFQSGNMEDNNLAVNSGDLSRGTLTGGSIESWTSATNMPGTDYYHTTTAYNGFLYMIGGTAVRYIDIGSGGTLGPTWTSGPSLTASKYQHSAIAYNGFLYAIGGSTSNTVYYIPINADGSLGAAWKQASSFGTARYAADAVAYNGYMYVIGGNKGSSSSACVSAGSSNYCNDVQYAAINADGSLGTWQSTTSFTTARYGHKSLVYNGYVYILGGNNGTTLSDVQYAPLNSSGGVGGWNTTTALGTARYYHGAAVYNGYVYVTGGNTSFLADTQYAAINANGTLGSWAASTNISPGRYGHTTFAYNGYLYISGGLVSGGSRQDIQYAAISTPGGTTGYTTSGNTFTNARFNHATVTYNGYIYVLGGRNGATYYNDVRFASISSNGTIGTWNTTATNLFSFAREGLSAVAYNGYMYVLGGRKSVSDANCRTSGSATWCNDVQKSLIGSNGTLGVWSSAGTGFLTPRWAQSAVIANGYLYVIAGSGGPVLADVQYTPIDISTGNIGIWSSANSITTARYLQTAVAYNGYMYVMGGDQNGSGTTCRASGTGSGTLCNDVQKALICTGGNNGVDGCSSTPGSLGTWSTLPSYFTTARSSHTAAAYNGYLYIIGGGDGSSRLSDVQYAAINADGTIGTWNTTTSLPAVRDTLSSAVYNGYLYVTGGNTGSVQNTATYTQLNNGGSGAVGSWTSTTSMPGVRSAHASVVYDGYVYVVGGYGAGYQNTVYYAPLSTAGGIGTWDSTNTFTTGRERMTAVAYNGYMYMMGGRKGSSSTACRDSGSDIYCNDVQKALICTGNNNGVDGCNSTPGSLGTWGSVGTGSNFTTPRYGHTTAAYNGYMYIFGGAGASGTLSTVYSAPINSDGTVGTWTVQTALPATRREHASVVYNGYIYVLGGAGSFVNTVYFAPLNSNGTVGSWIQTSSFHTPRNISSAVAANGYMYILGGFTTTQANDVQYAPINSNGTIGDWMHTTAFTTARDSHTAVEYSGYLYVLGGYTTTQVATTQYAPLSSIARKAMYSKLIDLGVPSLVSSITYTGTLPGGIRNIKYRVAGSDGVFGSTKNIADGLACNASTGKYIQLVATLDDSSMGVFRDDLSIDATLSSITVTSTPVNTPPEKRLRHGAWFLNEVQQPFDINTINCS